MVDNPEKRRSSRIQELIARAGTERRVFECLKVQTLCLAEEAIEQKKVSYELRRNGLLRRYLKLLPPPTRKLFH